MNKPSKKLLDLTIDITGERELEEFPKLLKLYTYALDMEIEIERLNNIIKTKDEGIKAFTEDLCEESAKIEKVIDYMQNYIEVEDASINERIKIEFKEVINNLKGSESNE